MDLTLIANDTRGGIEPYLALADEARSRGHLVRAVAPADYAEQFRAIGSAFAALRGVDRAAVTAHGGRAGLREMGRLVSELAGDWARDAAGLATGTDVVLAGIGGLPIARPVAQRIGVPLLRAHLQPIEAPSGAYPGPLLPQWDTGALTRRASHLVTAAGVALLTRPPERAARRALGLRGRPTAPLPEILYGFSPAVVPVASDAKTRRIATGYWIRPDHESPDPELETFLAADGPVVSVGFGSMHGQDPRALRDLVVGAVRRVGVRAVLLSGWGAISADERSGDDVFVTESAAHSRLFPRMAATVHHGGAGTTGAALTAGVPTVIVPFGADQPFWARRAQQLGVSPAPLPRSALTGDRLATALETALHDARMRERATELGATLRREGGARSAIDAVERLWSGRPERSSR